MNSIFASPNHISGPFHSYDGVPINSLGNNLMHMLFVYNVACLKKINFCIPKNTHLENLFNLSSYIRPIPEDAICLLKEEYGGNIDEYLLKDLKNVYKFKRLLKEPIQLPENFWVEGWFQALSLMPSEENFNKLIFKQEIQKEYDKNFKFLEIEDNISLHYRGSDFKNHAIGWGDMRLPFEYYKLCLESAKDLGIKRVNVFSDQKELILENLKLFKNDFEFYFISNNSYMDWYCLYKSKNLISSNSTFCWSAGLYNKNYIFQPRKFLLKNNEKDVLFPSDVYYNNSIVI